MFYRKQVAEILSHCTTYLGNWTVGGLIEMVFIADPLGCDYENLVRRSFIAEYSGQIAT